MYWLRNHGGYMNTEFLSIPWVLFYGSSVLVIVLLAYILINRRKTRIAIINLENLEKDNELILNERDSLKRALANVKRQRADLGNKTDSDKRHVKFLAAKSAEMRNSWKSCKKLIDDAQISDAVIEGFEKTLLQQYSYTQQHKLQPTRKAKSTSGQGRNYRKPSPKKASRTIAGEDTNKPE